MDWHDAWRISSEASTTISMIENSSIKKPMPAKSRHWFYIQLKKRYWIGAGEIVEVTPPSNVSLVEVGAPNGLVACPVGSTS